jgi:hypothetical protein
MAEGKPRRSVRAVERMAWKKVKSNACCVLRRFSRVKVEGEKVRERIRERGKKKKMARNVRGKNQRRMREGNT